MVRQQHCRNGRRRAFGKGNQGRTRRGVFRRLPVHVFRKRTTTNQKRNQRVRTYGYRNRQLLAAYARSHIPQDGGKYGTQPLHGGNCQPARTMQLDSQRPRRSNSQGSYSVAHGNCQGTSRRSSDGRRKPRCQARAGNRRRYRGHSGCVGHCRSRLPRGHSGKKSHNRRSYGATGQDIPHAGLLGLYSDAQNGGLRSKRQNRHLVLQRSRGRQGLCGQLQGYHPQKGSLR